MFSKIKFDREIDFTSNPPLPEKRIVVPGLNEAGSPINEFKTVPGDNRSPFEGITYCPDTMSLRAKLNMGVRLSPVSLQIENDPTKIANIALKFEHTINDRLSQLQASQVEVESPEVES